MALLVVLVIAAMAPVGVGPSKAGASGPAVVALAPPDTDAAAVVFDPTKVSAISLTLTDEAVAALNARSDVYVTATFSATIDAVSYGPWAIGVKLKGHASFRTLAGKSAFKLKFNHVTKTRRLLGLKKLTLNNMVQDASGLHEALAYDLFRSVGVPAPRAGYAVVTLNGQSYGLHSAIETLDDVSLARWFPSTQHLYDADRGSDVVPGGETGYSVDEGKDADRADLTALIQAAGTVGDGWRDAVDAVADLHEMVRMWAVEVYLGHWDGYSQVGKNNYYLQSTTAGRFSMIPWGTDQTFGYPLSFANDDRTSLLFSRCIDDVVCRSWYVEALGQARTLALALDLGARATARRAVVRAALDADPRKEVTMDQVDAAYDSTVAFIAARSGAVQGWLDGGVARQEHVTVTPGELSLLVAWSPPVAPGPLLASGYDVGWRVRGGQWQSLTVDSPSATSYVLGSLIAGSRMQVRVRARTGDVVSDWSDPVGGVPLPAAAPPGTPRSATFVSDHGGISVRWNAPRSDGGAPLLSFVIQVRRGTGGWALVATVDGAARSTWLDVVPTRTLQVRVAAVNHVKRGPFTLAKRR
jgi:hypothetical protein